MTNHTNPMKNEMPPFSPADLLRRGPPSYSLRSSSGNFLYHRKYAATTIGITQLATRMSSHRIAFSMKVRTWLTVHSPSPDGTSPVACASATTHKKTRSAATAAAAIPPTVNSVIFQCLLTNFFQALLPGSSLVSIVPNSLIGYVPMSLLHFPLTDLQSEWWNKLDRRERQRISRGFRLCAAFICVSCGRV